MTEKIGTIKNPLTIIAIFAGIAEVSGTVVLPFVSEANQIVFIWFLIVFPGVLVIIFFITLNFNNKALYAPSDFSNEENYIRIFRYDISRQEKVEVKITTDEMLKVLNTSITEMKNHSTENFSRIENVLRNLKELDKVVDAVEINIDDNSEPLVSISNFSNARILERALIKKGYTTEIYTKGPEGNAYSSYEEGKSIWLGFKVQLNVAKDIIFTAKNYYPHLAYISVSTATDGIVPSFVHESIYIGGATETAVDDGLKQLDKNAWKRLRDATTLEDFHSIIREFEGE